MIEEDILNLKVLVREHALEIEILKDKCEKLQKRCDHEE